MFSTVQQALDRARDLAGDPGAQVLTDDGAGNTVNLRERMQTAYAEFFRASLRYGNPFVNTAFHWIVPAYWSFLDPATASATSVGEIKKVFWKRLETEVDIANVTPNVAGSVCLIETAAAHGRSNGDAIVVVPPVGGITVDIHNEWTIGIVGASEFNLLGCRASGTFTSGGRIAYAPGGWSEFASIATGPLVLSGNGASGQVVWEGDRLRFPQVDYARLFKVQYTLSGQLPGADGDTIPFDDISDFLAYRAAGLGASARGESRLAMELNQVALGPAVSTEEPGGMLGDLVDGWIRGLNKNVYQLGRYHEPQTTGLPGSGVGSVIAIS